MPLTNGRGSYPGRSPCRQSRVSFAVSACVRMYSPASGKTLSDEPVGMKRDNEGARGRDMAPKDDDGMTLMIETMQTTRIEGGELMMATEETTLMIPDEECYLQSEEFSSSPSDSQDDQSPSFPIELSDMSTKRGNLSSESTKVFVGNLAGDINEEELGRMFNTFGTVVEIVLHRRRSVLGSGSAFIRFAESEAAHASIAALNGTSKGRGRRSRLPLVVRIADPPKANASGKVSPTDAQKPQPNLTEFRLSPNKATTRMPLGPNMGPQHFHQRVAMAGCGEALGVQASQHATKIDAIGVFKQHNPYSFECYIEQETCWERHNPHHAGTEDSGLMSQQRTENFAAYGSRDEPELVELEWAGQETDGSSSFDSLQSLEWNGGRRSPFESSHVQHCAHPAYSHNMAYIEVAPPATHAHPHAPVPLTTRTPSPYSIAPPPSVPPFTTPYAPSPKAVVHQPRNSSSWKMPQPPAIPLREKSMRSNTPTSLVPSEDGSTSNSAGGSPSGLEWPADAELLSTSPVGASLWDNMSRLLRPDSASLATPQPQQVNHNNPTTQQLNTQTQSSRPPLHRSAPSSVPPAFSTPTPTSQNTAPAIVGDGVPRYTAVLEHSVPPLENGFSNGHFATPVASGLGSDWVPHTEIPATVGHWGAHWA